MDKHIVYSKELTKADTLILKNLEADIKDVSAKPQLQDEGLGNGKTLSAFAGILSQTDRGAQAGQRTPPSARMRPSGTRPPCRP